MVKGRYLSCVDGPRDGLALFIEDGAVAIFWEDGAYRLRARLVYADLPNARRAEYYLQWIPHGPDQ